MNFNSHYNTSLPFITLKMLDLSKTEDIDASFIENKPIALFGCTREECLKRILKYIKKYDIPLFYPHNSVGMMCEKQV